MSINGIWYNELGSSMSVTINGNTISGTYSNAAGQAAGEYDFIGVLEPSPVNTNQALAWVVTWVRKADQKNFHSVTAWSGQYQLIQGIETITTEWLMTAETTPDADWASTNVGHDVFTRAKPSAETVSKRLKLSSWSHPKK